MRRGLCRTSFTSSKSADVGLPPWKEANCLARPDLLADMNISPQTVEDLRKAGWNTVRVSERLPATTPDDEILLLARNEGRVVVTQDLDFSALVALSGVPRPSLVTLRLSSSDPAAITQRLIDALPRIDRQLRDGSAVTIDDSNIRIRKLPIQ